MASDTNNPNGKSDDRMADENSKAAGNDKKGSKSLEELIEKIEMQLEETDELKLKAEELKRSEQYEEIQMQLEHDYLEYISEGSELDEKIQKRLDEIDGMNCIARDTKDKLIALMIENKKLRAMLASSEKEEHSKTTTDDEDKDV